MKVLLPVICGFLALPTFSQRQSAFINSAKEFIDHDIERHRWEIDVDVGGLLKLVSAGPYRYLIKINSKQRKFSKAWRFTLNPDFGTYKQFMPGDTSPSGSRQIQNYNIKTLFAVGHEWQKTYGRTMFLGGLDAAGQLQYRKGTAYDFPSPLDNSQGIIGTSVEKYEKRVIWLSTFLGVKFYLNHRISVSVESHLRFIHDREQTIKLFDNELVERNLTISRNIEPQPNYFIGLSYHL